MSEMGRFGLETNSGFLLSRACIVQKVLNTILWPLHGLYQETVVDGFVSSVQFAAFYSQGIHRGVVLQIRMIPELTFSAVAFSNLCCCLQLYLCSKWDKSLRKKELFLIFLD